MLQPFSQGNFEYFKLLLRYITKMRLISHATCYHVRLDNPAPLHSYFIVKYSCFNYACDLQPAAGKLFFFFSKSFRNKKNVVTKRNSTLLMNSSPRCDRPVKTIIILSFHSAPVEKKHLPCKACQS